MRSTHSLIYRDTFHLQASAAEIESFITAPEKVLAYYPLPRFTDVIEPGQSLIVSGWTGASLIEIIPVPANHQDTNSRQTIALRVSSALVFRHPITVEKIRQNAFFIMDEVLTLSPEKDHTIMEKAWINPQQPRLKWLPMPLFVRFTAKSEHAKITRHWRSPSSANA
ncbi:Uncharacterised protein [BD1-7 clade bacterium]|uniref:Uncharacterized protein n=1 Tax=BD1-7 clade bacterium TaxID=2029982 RepID=A0A5S9MUA1_9GAMM|nr:Uncharacterised protein [BD1-7 clade bacterium]CAA0084543.1 Uncharacterised protein [BD1-7 clade bacterium]